MPSRWEVLLARDPSIDREDPYGEDIPLAAPQAVVSGWLDDPRSGRTRERPASPARSGHGDQVRRWSCGPLLRRGEPRPGAGAPMVSLQVRLLDEGLTARLRAATREGSKVRLGQNHYQVAESAHLLGETSWPALRNWDGARAWQVRFATPCCFRRGSRTSPWPAPDSLWRSAAERWRQLNPGTAPPPPGPGAGPVWVSDIDGRSEVCVLTRKARRNGVWRLEDELISGFTGRIRYVCDGPEDDAAAFGAVLAFAEYGGAGSHTTYGFGVVVPEPTWQPPSARTSTP